MGSWHKITKSVMSQHVYSTISQSCCVTMSCKQHTHYFKGEAKVYRKREKFVRNKYSLINGLVFYIPIIHILDFQRFLFSCFGFYSKNNSPVPLIICSIARTAGLSCNIASKNLSKFCPALTYMSACLFIVYLTTLFQWLRLCSVEWMGDKWMKNLKKLEVIMA
jgi:hypothetical protein